ncbi:FF [Glarea lozoyensis ATCC 20868]|uniref:FF n=1 Tax=Glarea lozoyensis (strain ATCC 20868 / MF5171) TaxID=1116229 RepID=S3CSB9_GLAL2|nr:FF [Glarea lozoyensis ATCC 20868]EPE28575.1 FF [Glarea lozoyensis ATCC 20868]
MSIYYSSHDLRTSSQKYTAPEDLLLWHIAIIRKATLRIDWMQIFQPECQQRRAVGSLRSYIKDLDPAIRTNDPFGVSFIERRSADKHQAESQQCGAAADEIRSGLKYLEPPIRADDSFERVKPRIEKSEEYLAVGTDVLRRSAFDKVIRRLKEKDEDAEKDRNKRRERISVDRGLHHALSSKLGSPFHGNMQTPQTSPPHIDYYFNHLPGGNNLIEVPATYGQSALNVSPPPVSHGYPTTFTITSTIIADQNLGGLVSPYGTRQTASPGGQRPRTAGAPTQPGAHHNNYLAPLSELQCWYDIFELLPGQRQNVQEILKRRYIQIRNAASEAAGETTGDLFALISDWYERYARART